MADADHSICSVETCERTHVVARGFCDAHYRRWKKTGSAVKPCPTCGQDLPLGKGVPFCSPECRPQCTYEGCAKPRKGLGLCDTHLRRLRTTGSVHLKCAGCGNDKDYREKYCSDECKPSCGFASCEEPILSRGYCASHVGHLYTYGEVRELRHRRHSGDGCVVCQTLVVDRSLGRKFCSSACIHIYYTYGDSFVKSRACASCGEQIDLFEVRENGRRRTQHTLLCDSCKAPNARVWQQHLPELISRDGSACGICGDSVDPTLKFPDRNSPSVDHIVPRSLGGSDELSNLQLAHLGCNSLKKNRVDFKIA